MATQHGLYAQARDTVAAFLLSIKHEDMESILDDICTPSEIMEIDERLKIFQKLAQGKPQREIAADLGISVTTVNRGNRVLQYGTGIISKYIY